MFFGGGTPSLMAPETVGALIRRTRELWDTSADLEITLEANPTSVEADNFAALAEAGVNRVSLGVQALDPDALRFLGRQHSADEAIEALDTARRHFARTSFDLIYARPGQTPESWAAELDRALALAGEHLSLYQLTIERGTRFFTDHARGAFTLPGEEEAALMFEQTQARLSASGRPAYEISNHARPGTACRHNLIYWRYQDYVGVGPGAHGRFAVDDVKRATRRMSGPEAWLEAVERAGHGTAETNDVGGTGPGGGSADDGLAAGGRDRPNRLRPGRRRRSGRGAGRAQADTAGRGRLPRGRRNPSHRDAGRPSAPQCRAGASDRMRRGASILAAFLAASLTASLAATGAALGQTAKPPPKPVPQTAAKPAPKSPFTPPAFKITVATEGGYPPFNYLDRKGLPGGFEMDLAQEACQRMKAECEFTAVKWDDLIPGLLDKKFDIVMSSLEVNTDRRRRLGMSRRYYLSPGAFIAAKGAPFDGPATLLRNKRIGVQKDSMHADWVDKSFRRSAQIKRYALGRGGAAGARQGRDRRGVR